MAFLFGAKKHHLDEDPHRKLTRFKQCHKREVSDAFTGNGAEPIGQFSHKTKYHKRASASYSSRSVDDLQTPMNRNKSNSSDLHSTDPIPVDVLRRALPIRSAMIRD